MKAAVRLFLFALLAILATSAAAQVGWTRYRVYVWTPTQAQRLADCPLELFSEQISGETDVVVGPGQFPMLQATGLRYRYVSELPDPRDWWLYQPEGNDYRTSYLRYDSMIAQYEEWRAAYPQFVKRTLIGNSIEGRPIYAYRVSSGLKARKNIVIVGNTHAREWIATSVPMHLTERMINGLLTDPSIAKILRTNAVHVIPSLNPDGYEYSWINNRLWRKNRRNNGNGSFGVDLNRNYQIGWGGEGSSSNPSSDVYHGPAPFSEPELQHLRSYSLSLRGVTGFIDWHSYAEKILYPWSYTTAPSPGGPWHQSVGEQMRDSMVAADGHAYLVGQGSIALYVAGGVSKDWFYSSFGATSFTIELRDTGQNGFLLPESQITPTQNEAWAGFAKFLKLLL
jgi:murein tripeptide amidase MpaA